MDTILLTQDSTLIIGQVGWVLGKIMEGIFEVINLIGIPNIGLAIILFTIVINLLMLPLTIKQQKFSKLSAKMQPEIQAIQSKYKDKKDQESQMAMNQQIQAVYAKYGVSPSGSCVYMLIQLPILFSLYRVIYAMPAYVTRIGNTFNVLAQKIIDTDQAEFLKNCDISSIKSVVNTYNKNMGKNLTNGVIDVLNRLSSTDLKTISDHYGLSNLEYNGQLILSNDTTKGLLDTYNNFFGLNIANSPQNIISGAMKVGAWAIVVGAIMIPVLSAVTQWINVMLMPQQPKSGNEQADSMASSMKSMNMIMPLMSAWFCFTLPAGMGLYWIAGSVVRSIQQVLINKHIDKIDFDALIEKNKEKSAKKIEKMKAQQEKLNAYASMSTKNIQSKANVSKSYSNDVTDDTVDTVSNTDTKAKAGSMMSKANMVKDFNEKNNKQ